MPASTSHRLRWDAIPSAVRSEVAHQIGSVVVQADGEVGGYGPGVAARCRLADGRRVFIKAVSPAQNPDTPDIMRCEAVTVACLPTGAPSPQLLSVVDDGTWVVLVFEEVRGRQPHIPWEPHELHRVVAAMSALRRIRPPPGLPTVAERYGAMFTGWRTLAAEGASCVDDPWCARHLLALAELEARWEAVAAGDDLIHGDVRSDNILLVDDADVVFVDWSGTCVGQGWFDLLAMLPSIELEGGGSPEAVLAATAPDLLDNPVLAPVVAALAGYFAERVRRPDPPGLPTVRAFQRAQGAVTTAWLRRLLAWP